MSSAAALSPILVADVLLRRRGDEQRQQLEHELEEIGIRLNRSKPDVVFKAKTAGGITINTTVPLTRTDERTIRGILQAYKVLLLPRLRLARQRWLTYFVLSQIHNADVMIREDVRRTRAALVALLRLTLRASQISTDDLIDVILGNRKYVPCLYVRTLGYSESPRRSPVLPQVYNKIDSISLEEVDRLARLPHTMVMSCELDLNLEVFKRRVWEKMGFNRVYTKKRGEQPDLGDPLVIKTDATMEAVVRRAAYMRLGLELTVYAFPQCDSVHRGIKNKFKCVSSPSLCALFS